MYNLIFFILTKASNGLIVYLFRNSNFTNMIVDVDLS